MPEVGWHDTALTAIAASVYDELLEEMLCGDPVVRAAALVELHRTPYAGFRVADHACADDRGRPLVLTLQQLVPHLRDQDSPMQVADRGGRKHHQGNVRWHDPDAPGYGPGMAGAS